MSVSREVHRRTDLFDRPLTLTTTPEGGGFGWTVADTSAGGAPTYATITEDGGAMRLQLANDAEVENVCMFQNNILPLDLASLDYVKAIVMVANVGATTVASVGVGTARNDDEDAVTVNAYVKIEGAASTSALVVETDDNTTDNNDTPTGTTLAAVYKEVTLDFTNGLADVRFYIDGERVAASTTFDMSAITAGQNVQLLFQLSKGITAGQPTLTIAKVEVQYTTAYGA